MRNVTLGVLLVIVTILTSVIVGCGGGGGSNGLSRSVPTNIFVTDNFGDNYSQVWVTLYSIDLRASGSTSVTNVYSNASGQQINLADLAAKATFLNTITVPAGNYTSAQVTFGNTFTVTPKGSSTSQTITVASSVGTQSGGKVTVSTPTNAKLTSSQLSNVVIDFNLAAFQLIGGSLVPSIQQCSDSNFAGKAKDGDIEGTVSALTATGFTITRASRTWNVVTTSTTTVVSQSTGKTVTLANGNIVEVQGTFDTTSQTFTATSIVVNDLPAGTIGSGTGSGDDDNGRNHGGGGPIPSRAGLSGLVSSVDSTTGNIVVTLTNIRHFTVSTSTVTVATNSHTQFRKPGATTASLADVTAGGAIQVNGIFDSTTNILTATSVFVGVAAH